MPIGIVLTFPTFSNFMHGDCDMVLRDTGVAADAFLRIRKFAAGRDQNDK